MNRRFLIPSFSPPTIARPTLLRSSLSLALLAGALALTGCDRGAVTADSGAAPQYSQSEGSAAPPTATEADDSATSNAADVTFANGVIAHHTQAVRMADMALAQDSSPEVNELAGDIKAAQGPEIDRMSACLTRWGTMDPETMDDTMGMPGGSMHEPMAGAMDEPVAGSMGQMMSEQDLTALSETSGPEFDRAWLAGMTAHLQGEVTLAQAELEDGSDADAMQLAREIMSSHPAKITRMQELLESPS